MNINEPDISRTLAILIQPVEHKERRNFIRMAEEANEMREFMKDWINYERNLKDQV